MNKFLYRSVMAAACAAILGGCADKARRSQATLPTHASFAFCPMETCW